MNKQNDKQTNQGLSRKLVSISSTLNKARGKEIPLSPRDGGGEQNNAAQRTRPGGRGAAGTSSHISWASGPVDDTALPCSVLKHPLPVTETLNSYISNERVKPGGKGLV